MLFKIKIGMVDVDASDIPRPSDRRTRDSQRLYQPYAESLVNKRSLYPYTIQEWNNLPAAVTDAPSVEAFQALLSSPSVLLGSSLSSSP